ncbi:MAG TPA: immunoglobulin domain-containing protein, partial [Verrucomicrobiae bacterium]
TAVGTGTAGYSGDGGAATSATLNNPIGLAIDGNGNLFISDYSNQRIRKVVWASGPVISSQGPALTIYNVGFSNAGNYQVIVSSSWGSVTSSVATLTVNGQAPSITMQPLSNTNLVGTPVTFAVTANGTALLSYQWSVNGTNILGATNSTLTLNSVQVSDAGTYSVLVANDYGVTNSAAANLMVVLPPTITQQPQSQTVLSYNAAAFTITVSGTGPLAYQWRKNGTNLVDGGNISGSTTTNLAFANVSLVDAGNYDVIITSPYAATNSAVAILAVPQTVVALGATNAMSGSTITVPVRMNALGVENTFLASVGYDPTKLTLQTVQLGQATAGAYLQEVDTQTNNGYVGFAILLDTGATIPAGTQEVARLVFQTLPVTNNTTVNLTFGDTPTGRQVVDNNLNNLPALYQGSTVSLTPAEYAADVYPRTNGDHQVSVQDWLEVGRMVAGLDVVTNSDELLRADSAPRNAPDGILTVADWVQAGRYALGLDPLTLVTTPATPGAVAKAKSLASSISSRVLLIGNVSAPRGQAVSVPVQLICATNENAVGMTVSYNPNQLTFTGVSLGAAITSGRLNVNSNQVGKVGVVLALSPGAALAAGTNEVAVLRFLTSPNASGTSSLTLDGTVASLQVADKMANSLAAAYVNGSVALPPQPTMAVAGINASHGGGMQLTWQTNSGTFQVQCADSVAGPWTTVVLPLVTNGADVSVTVTPTNQHQYFRLQGQ